MLNINSSIVYLWIFPIAFQIALPLVMLFLWTAMNPVWSVVRPIFVPRGKRISDSLVVEEGANS